MGNAWWIRKTNLRGLKKYRSGIVCDGTQYPFSAWEQKLEEVKNLKGNSIWNPLTDKEVLVLKVYWQWEPVCRINNSKPASKIIGSFISGFVIHTDDGVELTETPSFMNTLPRATPAPYSSYEYDYYDDEYDDEYYDDDDDWDFED